MIKEAIMSNMMKENGKAAMIIVFCKAVSPLTDNKITAMTDKVIPQASFTLFGGVIEPFVDNIPRTNVAESAEVMKNEAISTTAKIETIVDNGMEWNISNIVNSVEAFAKLATPLFCRSIAVVPKAENQIAPSSVGATSTPETNSLIVLPFDTRAMNILTKGAHEIHQAQ